MSEAPNDAAAQRLSVIKRAAAEWDAESILQETTSRAAFINLALRDAKMARTDDAELEKIEAGSGDQERREIANRASAEFDRDSGSLLLITNKAAFVQDALRAAGKQPLSATELRLI